MFNPRWLVCGTQAYEGGPRTGVRIVAMEEKWGAVNLDDNEALELVTRILETLRDSDVGPTVLPESEWDKVEDDT